MAANRPTPLFAAAAALIKPDSHANPLGDTSLTWLSVGSTFVDVPHGWSGAIEQLAARRVVESPDADGIDELEDADDPDGDSRESCSPPPTDEPKLGLPPAPSPPAPPSLFVNDRAGDRDQARFQRMYAGDKPAYHAPPAALRHAPVGTAALAGGRRRRLRIADVSEGVGSGVIRPALSHHEAEAARAGGGVWAQVSAERAAAARSAATAHASAGRRYFHSAAAAALGDANSRAAAALDGAAGAHLSEGGARLAVLRRGALAAAGAGDAGVADAAGAAAPAPPEDASERLARLISEGYARQGLAAPVVVAAGGGGSGGGGDLGGAAGRAAAPGFLPLMPVSVAAAAAAAASQAGGAPSSASAAAAAPATEPEATEVVSAARAPWETEAGYAARRLRQLHSLARRFPADQRVWRTLMHTTLALHGHWGGATDGPAAAGGSRAAAAARAESARRVALEAALALAESALRACRPAPRGSSSSSRGARAEPAPEPPQQLLLDRLRIVSALGDAADASAVDAAWCAALLPRPGPPGAPPPPPQPRLWVEHLLWLRGSFGCFSLAAFRARVHAALGALSAARAHALDALSGGAVTLIAGGASSSLATRLRLCDEAALDVLSVAAATEAGAGHAERGVALWQAAFEFNVGHPAALAALPPGVSERFFAGFWDSEAPRVGDAHPSARAAVVSDECAEGADGDSPSAASAAAASLYLSDVAASGWVPWQRRLVAALSPAERAAAGLVAAGARRRRFNAVAEAPGEGRPDAGAPAADPDPLPEALYLPAFKALSEAFAAGERLSGLAAAAAAARRAGRGAAASTTGSSAAGSSATAAVSSAAAASASAVPEAAADAEAVEAPDPLTDVSSMTERRWGCLGLSELTFEALSLAQSAREDAAAAAAAAEEAARAAPVPPLTASAAGSDSEDDSHSGAGGLVAAALVRAAAAKTSAGARAAALAVPPGFVSYYSPLHGHRIVVPEHVVTLGGGAELVEAAGEGEAYRRALLNAATDRGGRTAAAAAAAAAAASAGSRSSAGLALPSAVPQQAAPAHPLSQWLRRCAPAPGADPDDCAPRAPLRLCEVDPQAYAPPPPPPLPGAPGASSAPPAPAAEAPGSGWVTVESASGAADGGALRAAPGPACALAAAARLVLARHSHVPFDGVRCVSLGRIGAPLHAALIARFLAHLGVRLRPSAGSSRSTAHALGRATGAGALRPGGGPWAALGSPGVDTGGASPPYAGQVADVDPEAVSSPAVAGLVRRVLHRALLPSASSADPLPSADVAAGVALLRAALVDFEAAAALHAARAGAAKAYEGGRRAVRAVLSVGSIAGSGGGGGGSPWAAVARCQTGVDEWLAYARFEAAFGRRERAAAPLSAILSRAARAPPGPAACSPSVALIALEFCALSAAAPPESGGRSGSAPLAAAQPAGATLVSVGLALVPAPALVALAGATPADLASPVGAARAALRVGVTAAARAYAVDVERACARWVADAAAARRGGGDDSAGGRDALFAAALAATAEAARVRSGPAPCLSRWMARATDAVWPAADGAAPPKASPPLHAGFTEFAAPVSARLGQAAPATSAPGLAGAPAEAPPADSATVLGIAPLLACAAIFAYVHSSDASGNSSGGGDVAAADALFRRAYVLLLGLVRTLVVARLRVEGAYAAAPEDGDGGEEDDEEEVAQAEEDVASFMPALGRWLKAVATPAASRLSARLAHLAPVVFASGRTVPPTTGGGGSDGLSTAELRSAVLSPSGGLGLSAGFPDPLGPLDAGLADSSTALGAAVDALLAAAEWLVGWHVWLLRAHAASRAAPPRLLRQALQLAATAFPGNLGFVYAYLAGGDGGGAGAWGAALSATGGGASASASGYSGGGDGWGALTSQAHLQGVLGQWGPDAPPEPRVARLLVALAVLARLLASRLSGLVDGGTSEHPHSEHAALGDVAAATAAVKRLGLALLIGGAVGEGIPPADWASLCLSPPSAAPRAAPVLWRAVLRALLLAGEPPGLALRQAFLRGVHACPWARPLWLDVLGRLRAYLSPGGAAGVLRAAAGRGVAVPPCPGPSPSALVSGT